MHKSKMILHHDRGETENIISVEEQHVSSLSFSLHLRVFEGIPFVVTQLLKKVVEGGRPFERNSSFEGFSCRRALASAAR